MDNNEALYIDKIEFIPMDNNQQRNLYLKNIKKLVNDLFIDAQQELKPTTTDYIIN
ncbi:hypothetical protein ABE219_13630 [Bacillus paranthracis]|uniref:hypothetical protein n=1 Tax=Bacillus paranthracis TaxID=2026186 RepID=UPI000200ED37|nr:hypothetical protein [Bacillus paranthracis]ADY24719.1 hypothetical protein YBT020_27814 [Bacillus thuringiensis serovar finitimus YBT-020]MED1252381.1 hypothetical protein [Bacillus paranthracis]MED1316688.1 hypothetical protein [Bacillus paranthracis]MED1327812.1 hypothetical protein [Bacillus paranthracis]MED1387559.1 hypothetical protein [Bacillus paranthracis]